MRAYFCIRLKDLAASKRSVSNQLCLSCGLCCNGVVFRDVKLQPNDDPDELRSLGLAVLGSGGARPARFLQPCKALEGCQCRIYADRPAYCRQFECGLFKSVLRGRTEPAEALRLIRAARRGAEKVRRLLRALGDADEGISLAVRFRRAAKRLKKASVAKEEAEIFGRLTLAMHDLNLLLSGKFYPGEPS